MANAPLTERVATVAEAFEKVGPALKAYATYCAGYAGTRLGRRARPHASSSSHRSLRPPFRR